MTFEEEIKSKYPDLVLLSPYKSAREKIHILYPCGCTHWAGSYDLKRRGTNSKCKNCTSKKKPHEQFERELKALHPHLICRTKYDGARIPVKVLNSKCGHEYEIVPNGALTGASACKCLVCEVHNTTLTTEELTKRISSKYTNYEVTSKYTNTLTNINIKNSICGHEFPILPHTILYGNWSGNCPICYDTTRLKTDEIFRSQMSDRFPNIEVLEEYKGSKERLNIKYRDCGHTTTIRPNDILSGSHGDTCEECHGLYGKAEKEISDFISKHYSGWIELNDRTILEGKELDIVLPDLGLAFEYNGIRWHNDKSKPRNYHKDKTDRVNEFGYKLIHIMEDEWVNKQNIVKSRILNLLNKSTRVFARNLYIESLSWQETKQFLESNHIRGAGTPSLVNLGLMDNENNILAVMTFSTPKTVAIQEYELVRYATKLNTNVIGGASKLLKWFITYYKPNGIISYSDKRWSNGNLYKVLGFNYSHTSDPGYRYYKRNNSLSREKCQKHKLKDLFPEIYRDELTEPQIMELAGYVRVFDSGNDVWIK